MCLLASLGGCLSAPALDGSPTLREARRLEAAVTTQRVVAAPVQSLADLARAARLYALIDDSPGVARVYLAMARVLERQGRVDKAGSYARAALQLAREGSADAYRYRALLAVGRLERDPERFEQALTLAAGPLEQAVALTYLSRHAAAFARVNGLEAPGDAELGDLAFVLYNYAYEALDRNAAQRALQLYKRADDYSGVARSLDLLARIADGQGDEAAARDFAGRAGRAASALRGADLVPAPRQAAGAP